MLRTLLTEFILIATDNSLGAAFTRSEDGYKKLAPAAAEFILSPTLCILIHTYTQYGGFCSCKWLLVHVNPLPLSYAKTSTENVRKTN